MANTNETIADIIAEMRALSNPISDGIIAINGRSIADRLEAALGREKPTAEKSSTVGDCAKLREACQKMRDLLMRRGDGKALCVLTWDEFNESQKMLRAALAAPARNCDRYSHDEALRIWSAETENPMNGCFDVWLYAPAMEQRGENNANK